MSDATRAPLRMRYSFEARCRAVGERVAGASVHAAAASVGASRATGYRWWRRFRDGGWGSLQERRPIPRRQPRRLSADAAADQRRTGEAGTGDGRAPKHGAPAQRAPLESRPVVPLVHDRSLRHRRTPVRSSARP